MNTRKRFPAARFSSPRGSSSVRFTWPWRSAKKTRTDSGRCAAKCACVSTLPILLTIVSSRVRYERCDRRPGPPSTGVLSDGRCWTPVGRSSWNWPSLRRRRQWRSAVARWNWRSGSLSSASRCTGGFPAVHSWSTSRAPLERSISCPAPWYVQQAVRGRSTPTVSPRTARAEAPWSILETGDVVGMHVAAYPHAPRGSEALPWR